MSAAYLTSANRAAKRGELIGQLRQACIDYARLIGKTPDVVNLRCMLCGISVFPEAMHMHEIIRRGLIANKSLLDYLPVEFHAMLCADCNLNHADSRVDILVGRSIGLWGIERVRAAVQAFNDKLVEVGGYPLSPAVFPYELIKEQSDEQPLHTSGSSRQET